MSELLYQFLVFGIFSAVMYKSSELAIKSADGFSKIFRLGHIAVGFILLSVIANMPELSVLMSSVATGNIDVSIGNIFGTVIVNATLIFGLVSLLFSVRFNGMAIKKLSPMIFVASSIPLFLNVGVHIRVIGIVLLSVFLWFAFSIGKKGHKKPLKRAVPQKRVFKVMLHILVGAVGIFASGYFLVDSAVRISSLTGIGSSIIGSSIVAIATSLPDIFLSVIAVRKGYVNMALGEIFGSNLTAMSLVLGLALMFSLPTAQNTLYPVFTSFLVIASVMFWLFSRGERSGPLEGAALLAVYIFFVMTMFGMGTAA